MYSQLSLAGAGVILNDGDKMTKVQLIYILVKVAPSALNIITGVVDHNLYSTFRYRQHTSW